MKYGITILLIMTGCGVDDYQRIQHSLKTVNDGLQLNLPKHSSPSNDDPNGASANRPPDEASIEDDYVDARPLPARPPIYETSDIPADDESGCPVYQSIPDFPVEVEIQLLSITAEGQAEFRVVNQSEGPLCFYSYSKDSFLSKVEVFPGPEKVVGYCGNGLGVHVFEVGQAITDSIKISKDQYSEGFVYSNSFKRSESDDYSTVEFEYLFESPDVEF